MEEHVKVCILELIVFVITNLKKILDLQHWMYSSRMNKLHQQPAEKEANKLILHIS